jgi:hypothetical protein
MANIIGCEVVSLESYYKPEQVRDYKYDDYSLLDISLLTKVTYRISSSLLLYRLKFLKCIKISFHFIFVNTCVPKLDGKAVTKCPSIFRTGHSNSLLYDTLKVFFKPRKYNT